MMYRVGLACFLGAPIVLDLYMEVHRHRRGVNPVAVRVGTMIALYLLTVTLSSLPLSLPCDHVLAEILCDYFIFRG